MAWPWDRCRDHGGRCSPFQCTSHVLSQHLSRPYCELCSRHHNDGTLQPRYLESSNTDSHDKKSPSRDDVMKWKHFPRYWPFMLGIHRPPVNSPHKGQWRRALMLSLICAWINGWVDNGEASDLRRHRAHYDVTAMHCGDAMLRQRIWLTW